jgi:hypothetical protein
MRGMSQRVVLQEEVAGNGRTAPHDSAPAGSVHTSLLARPGVRSGHTGGLVPCHVVRDTDACRRAPTATIRRRWRRRANSGAQ